ncbi:AmmeMemoRadiSam system radical SAM enzyme [Carboxylicivirga mesophila]|uniref:AmmeMemoRadiSam system radical SAM enzyme n=1 Tax=Carboxylicivirga mesophila TaxID=1166478 RepID=A0ABS5KCX2_9BACT|nr:AmmeMemoRadiSam system radical SAM enzyme [Carboxylicivirga mesophila]MBS2212816.1 AmmeMemoRadiSam system radical SAM enzyme [Carboxylicivirga mesophila]
MYEAMYYRQTADTVICELCPHMCQLKEGEVGKCRVRVCQQQRLHTLAYANPCAIHVDPVEKKPLYHFLPGTKTFSIATAGCNLACLNCQNSSISQVSPNEASSTELAAEQVVEAAISYKCKSISYTYTDPTVYYEYMLETSKVAKREGLLNIMVSAGYINSRPLDELLKYIDGANIDLKCFDDALYQRLCGIRLKPVLKSLQTIKRAGVWLEITNLVIPQMTDDWQMINLMIDWLVDNDFQTVPIHFNRFVPAYKLEHLNATPRELLFKIAEMAQEKGMRYVYVGNVGKNRYQNTYCSDCKTEAMKRSYYNTEMLVDEVGNCPNCNSVIPGIWH